MGLWTDVVGTVRGYIRLGLTGVRLKNSSGTLAVRNAGDSAYANVECGDIYLGPGNKLVFEGTTDDAYETTVDPGNPTADRTLVLPDESGTFALTSMLSGFRNRLINPRGAVYQRTVAATADDTYFADRWYALTQTGTITPSVLTDPEDGYPSGIRLTQSQASAQRFGFAQIIEGKNCKDMRGSSGVLVPRIRASASQAIRYAILGWTGTEDAVTSDVVNDWTSGTYTAGNFFLASDVSVIAVGSQTPSANTWTSLTALTAALGSTFNNIVVMVWTEGTAAQNVTLDFDYVQLEKGAIALPFEMRNYDRELWECKRYCIQYTSDASVYIPFHVNAMKYTSTGVVAFGPWERELRVAPTITCSAIGDLYALDTAGIPIAATGSLTLNNLTRHAGNIQLTAGATLGGGPGDATCIMVGPGTGKYVRLDAEL